MKFALGLLLLGLFLSGQICNAQKLSGKGITIIVVKEHANEVVFEKIHIEKDQIKILTDPSIITTILPLSEGKAANFVKPSDREGAIIVKNSNGTLHITYKTGDGEEKSYPSILYDDLKKYQIRVNVINGKGYKQAFIIDNYDVINEDDGPVIDIFGGMIPMDSNDYSITLETRINIPTKVISGSVPFEKIDSWIVVEAKLPSGKVGKYILDTGASGGLVLIQRALPENIKISKLTSIAYSKEGSTENKGQMLAATGVVEDDNFLGVAQLSSFEMGDIKLVDLEISVLRDFPEFLQKHHIIGVIGIEILKQAEIIRIERINEERGMVKFMNQEDRDINSFDHNFSLNTAYNLLFIKGVIQDVPIDFLIDIGARRSVIASSLVVNNHIEYSTIGNSGVGGLSGEKSDAIEGQISEIKIENDLFKDVPLLIISSLFATKRMGLEKSGILLGMSFFSQFKTMEIDFINKKLYLENLSVE